MSVNAEHVNVFNEIPQRKNLQQQDLLKDLFHSQDSEEKNHVIVS